MSYLWILIFRSLLHLNLFRIIKSDIIITDGEGNKEIFFDTEWPYAQPVWRNGMKGVIIDANPSDACTNISGPPAINLSLNWFVLVAGNSCDYDTKVVYSQMAGFSAAVIYTLGQKDYVPYKYPSKQIYPYPNISAVIIRTKSGLIIKEKYLYTISDRYRVFIYPNNSFNFNTFLLLFAIVAGIFIFVMLSFMIVRCIQQTQYGWNNRLSSYHLRQLLVSKYKKGDPYDTCAICLEDYKEKEKLRILPCHHGYHAKCIDPWLVNNRRICPVCKQKVTLGDEYSDTNSESDTQSRAESTPLLRNDRGGQWEPNNYSSIVPHINANPSEPLSFDDNDETTSRDATSEAFDEISDNENTSSIKLSIDSAVQVDFPFGFNENEDLNYHIASASNFNYHSNFSSTSDPNDLHSNPQI